MIKNIFKKCSTHFVHECLSYKKQDENKTSCTPLYIFSNIKLFTIYCVMVNFSGTVVYEVAKLTVPLLQDHGSTFITWSKCPALYWQ